MLPSLLALVFHRRIESRMVEGGGDACLVEHLAELLGTSATACIDDSRSLHTTEDMDQFLALVGRMTDYIGEVRTLETHAEDIKCPLCLQGQFILYVLDHSRSRRRCKCKDGRIGYQFADLGYLQIRRTEIIAPLRDAMGFVDRYETDAHVAELRLE